MKKFTDFYPLVGELNQKLSLLNSLKKIKVLIQNFGCSLKELIEILALNNYETKIYCNEFLEESNNFYEN